MKEYKSRWNDYKIGDIGWINRNREHHCRLNYIDYILDSGITSIVEVGAGEVIEGRELIKKNPEISYSVVDVSETFLNYCKTLEGISAYKGDMIDLPFNDKQFDLIYVSSVLEHSPDIKKTINGMARVSNRFYFNMFKWMDKGGGLNSEYRGGSKKYYSTCFNIDMLLNLISEYGSISDTFVSGKNIDSKFVDFDKYRSENDICKHRTGDYLTIRGYWNNE